MHLDGGADAQGFVEVFKKNEQYAQKVRKEIRGCVKDCLKMWIYLSSINQQSADREWAVQMRLDAEKSKQQARERPAVL